MTAARRLEEPREALHVVPSPRPRCLPFVLRRPAVCDPAPSSCWKTWTPERRARPGLAYDEPEAVTLRDREQRDLLAYLAHVAAHPPAPTALLPRSYPGRPAPRAPEQAQGVAGDLAAALHELPDRRSRVRRAT